MKPLLYYYTLEVDDDGDLLDWGHIRADPDEVIPLLREQFDDLGLLESYDQVAVRVYTLQETDSGFLGVCADYRLITIMSDGHDIEVKS